MNFMVVWMPRAQDDLAKLWLDESLRSRIALLAHGLERRLSKDPETMGLLAFDNVYTAEADILGVEYEVIPDDRHVRVLRMWSSASGRPEPTDN